MDNGRKWKADSATNDGIETMRGLVETFAPDSNVEPLKSELDRQFVQIRERCTMQGEAHEQLHHYLVPLKSKIEGLDNGNKAATVPELKTTLAAYWNYFGR